MIEVARKSNVTTEMVNDLEKRLAYAKENTSLPSNPNMKKVEEFVMSVNRRAIDE